MSVSEVMEKQMLYGRLHEFYSINQIQMRTSGEGVKKSENFASYLEAPRAAAGAREDFDFEGARRNKAK